MGTEAGITHREAQLAELSDTERPAALSAQPRARGLPLWFKGGLAQGLQLVPLLLKLMGRGIKIIESKQNAK